MGGQPRVPDSYESLSTPACGEPYASDGSAPCWQSGREGRVHQHPLLIRYLEPLYMAQQEGKSDADPSPDIKCIKNLQPFQQ
ncbi:hypothetical protein E2C01_005768 [Portunus trituberculatus]|uniref:Uncharacterized protein n=1 Tax=Portunus trituberculatus TaxID=210409 RepID=A0A5B7CUC3_PORTR|nr:hypothetical protein [Portunus trituberculatus]